MAFDRWNDECGVFGVWDNPEAARLTYLGLYALQHRGQESAGITSTEGKYLTSVVDMGLVADIFSPERLDRLEGNAAIGHVRYSTSGHSVLKNAQPLTITCHRGEISLAHNGNLTNGAELRKELEAAGHIFSTTSDTEVILHLIARSRASSLEEAIIESLRRVEGAYSLVFLTPEKMIAIRDPHGFRPLSMARLRETMVFSSETCAFDLIDAQTLREVQPGEMVVVDAEGVRSEYPFAPAPSMPCVFELIYFARPDSTLDGINVYQAREAFGRQLAKEHPVEADVVVPVPDSGVGAALGYAAESGIGFSFGLVRNHYVGRTFIEPRQSIRDFGVRLKLNPVRDLIAGKRVVLVDDSVVRGTTSRKIVRMVRAAGAREVHLRISSPPTTHSCFYGIDTPERKELIAAAHSVEEIARYVEADSLGYLSIPGLFEALNRKSSAFCKACFDGQYPVDPEGTSAVQSALFAKER